MTAKLSPDKLRTIWLVSPKEKSVARAGWPSSVEFNVNEAALIKVLFELPEKVRPTPSATTMLPKKFGCDETISAVPMLDDELT